nr:hypothetical protein [uncultured Lichenicoccus sp.]
MTALTTFGGKPTSAVPVYVEAGGVLGATIRAVARGSSVGLIAEPVQQAAWARLREIERLTAVATEDHMLVWLVKLAPAVANAPATRQDLQAKAAAIWAECGSLPCAVWCDETRSEWVRTLPAGKFWPTAGELFVLLGGFAGRIFAERRGCEAILAEASRQANLEPPAGPSDEARAAVTEMLRSWRDEVAERHEAERQADIAAHLALAPAVVSDELLLAQHEKLADAGNGASKLRVEFLRKKLEAQRQQEAEHARYA